MIRLLSTCRGVGHWALLVGALALTGCSSDDKAKAPAAEGGGPAIAPATGDAATSAPAAAAARESWPTEDQAKAAILKIEYDIRASQTNKDVWHVKDLRHEVHSVKFGDRTTQKQMNYGRDAVTVYPAKILYTRITEYTDKEATREEAGADGVWFLYQDSFGDWTGKYGTE